MFKSSSTVGLVADSVAPVQEFNSVEAIKGAVQYGLGAAFVSSAAIAKELDLGLFKRIDISGVRLSRTLSLVSPPCPLPGAPCARLREGGPGDHEVRGPPPEPGSDMAMAWGNDHTAAQTRCSVRAAQAQLAGQGCWICCTAGVPGRP